MSVYHYAYTASFPKDSKITWDQAFEALRVKARAPGKFVAAIAQCDVLEETPTTLKRKVALKNGAEMVEDVVFYKPTLVEFKSNTGVQVNNILAKDSDDNLCMTFTFVWPLPDIEPGSEAEATRHAAFKAGGKEAVEQSIKVTLELLEEGKLN